MGAEKLIVVMVGLMVLAGTAHGQLGIVNGTLCCTPTGGCTPGALPLVDVNVSLSCPPILGINLATARNVTTSTGQFSISLPAGLLLSSILQCSVNLYLPLNQTICPVLSTVNGTLSSVLTLVNTTTGRLGAVLAFVLSAFNFTLFLAV